MTYRKFSKNSIRKYNERFDRVERCRPRIHQRKRSKPSSGEQKIIDFLLSNCVDFKREWFFADCYSRVYKNLLYFDFWLPEYNMCIEFDGEQHYANDKPQRAIENDFIKTAYCHKKGIKLLRIKYNQFNEIEKIICAAVDAI